MEPTIAIPILGIIVINPTLESVTEAKMTSQNYDAEFGQAIAGVVASQTKSGTNSLHGSVFGFRRSDATQARDPFSQSPSKANPVTGRTIPPILYGQYGASVGGPVIKDKLFFFGDYQATRSKIGSSFLQSIPSDADSFNLRRCRSRELRPQRVRKPDLRSRHRKPGWHGANTFRRQSDSQQPSVAAGSRSAATVP